MMRLLFLSSTKKREKVLAEAVCRGAQKHGWQTEISQRRSDLRQIGEFDAVAMVGVKSAKIWRATRKAGAVPIMFDKGYCRHRSSVSRVWEYWRIAVNGHQPTEMLMDEDMPSDRFDALGLDVEPWREGGSHVLIAGSSAKFHAFHDLPDPTTWARKVAKRLRKAAPHLPIIYRPKPSWRDAVHIPRTTFSGPKDKLAPVLQQARAVVTYGSNISFEAALCGVPSIVLGNGIGAPISSREISDINNPRRADRSQWFANLAYWQWTEAEMRRGQMWSFVAPKIEGVRG